MDQDIFIGLTAVLSVLLGGIIVLVPVIGFTLRFALRPALEAWMRLRADPTLAEKTELLSRQVALLEAEVQHLQGSVQSLSEVQEFQRRLEASNSVST